MSIHCSVVSCLSCFYDIVCLFPQPISFFFFFIESFLRSIWPLPAASHKALSPSYSPNVKKIPPLSISAALLGLYSLHYVMTSSVTSVLVHIFVSSADLSRPNAFWVSKQCKLKCHFERPHLSITITPRWKRQKKRTHNVSTQTGMEGMEKRICFWNPDYWIAWIVHGFWFHVNVRMLQR